MEWGVLKSIAAFANSFGGSVLVGVADNGSVIGVEGDFPFVKKQNLYGWELWLNDAASTSMGRVIAADLNVKSCCCYLDGGTVVRVDVGPAAKPVFVSHRRTRTPGPDPGATGGSSPGSTSSARTSSAVMAWT